MTNSTEDSELTTRHGNLLDRLANLLSYILHPAILIILTVLLISMWTRDNPAWAIIDVSILIVGLLPGLLYIYIKTRQGQFSHFHLLLKEERNTALPLLFIGVLASFVIYVLTQASIIMMKGMVIGLIAGLGAIIVSRYWKISLHAAVAMGCAGLFIPISWIATIVFVVAGLIAGLTRLRVQHHTVAQVLVGWLYGFGMGSLSVLWIGNVAFN